MANSSIGYRSLVVGACLFGAAHTGGQGFVEPSGFGWERSDPTATHHEWDDFVSASGDNPPDVAASPAIVPGSAVVPNLIETTGTAFRTTTGNIYSITSIIEFELVVPTFQTSGGTTEVLLQTRTLGREVDPATILADGLPPVESIELFREFLGPDTQFGGSLVYALWRFEVPSTDAVTIVFAAEDTSLSLDKLSVDTVGREADCLADVNGNGVTDPGDFTAWIAAYNTGSPAADQNGDGIVNPGDFTAWVANYNMGCP